jgi:monovalent cation:H+ antiporter, CPA1 family
MNSSETLHSEAAISIFDAPTIEGAFKIDDLLGILLTLAILLRILNYHTIKWPPSILLAIGSIACTIVVVILSKLTGKFFGMSMAEVRTMFSVLPDLVLNYMLGFLLFASAIEVDVQKLRRIASTVFALSVFSTLISALLTAILTHLLLLPFVEIDFTWCFLYGVIVSPTDPVVILSILNEKPQILSPSMLYFVIGESLLNDFMGVALYIVAKAIVNNPEMNAWDVLGAFTKGAMVEGLMGVTIGLTLAYIAYSMIQIVDDTHLEVAITFVLVANINLICRWLDASIPLASVSAGLYIGNVCDEYGFSSSAKELFKEMWKLVDEALNSILFLLIGATDVFYDMGGLGFGNILFIMIATVAISLFSRFTSVAVPLGFIVFLEYITGFSLRFPHTSYGPDTVAILTWGGMRGGISIALVLAVPDAFARHAVTGFLTNAQMLFFMTFTVVMFSLGVQGLSFENAVRFIQSVWPAPAPVPSVYSPVNTLIRRQQSVPDNISRSKLHPFHGIHKLPRHSTIQEFLAKQGHALSRRILADRLHQQEPEEGANALHRSATVPIGLENALLRHSEAGRPSTVCDLPEQ